MFREENAIDFTKRCYMYSRGACFAVVMYQKLYNGSVLYPQYAVRRRKRYCTNIVPILLIPVPSRQSASLRLLVFVLRSFA